MTWAYRRCPRGVTPPPKQSEAAFTGGSVIDLGLLGAENDQLGQLFTVGVLSTGTSSSRT